MTARVPRSPLRSTRWRWAERPRRLWPRPHCAVFGPVCPSRSPKHPEANFASWELFMSSTPFLRGRVRSAVAAVALAAASLSTVAATTLTASAKAASAGAVDPSQLVTVRVDAAKGRGDTLWARIPGLTGGTVLDMHGDAALVSLPY